MPLDATGHFFIDEERGKLPAQKGRFYRRPSPVKQAADRRTAKYEGRSNTCPQCHTVRSATGDCDC